MNTEATVTKKYRVHYIVWYNGTAHNRELYVEAPYKLEARRIAALKILNIEPEADDYEIHGDITEIQ